MKNIVFALLLCFAAISARGATDLANINQGNIRLGGGVGVGYSTYSSTIVSVSPLFQYFVADGFAVGLDTDLMFSKNYDTYAAGPLISYYFWNREKWAAYLEQSFKYFQERNYRPDVLSADPYWVSTSTVGANYFFTPYVAIGPKLSYSIDMQERANDERLSTVNLTGHISVFF